MKFYHVIFFMFFSIISHSQITINGEVYSTVEDSLIYTTTLYNKDSIKLSSKIFYKPHFKFNAVKIGIGDFFEVESAGYQKLSFPLITNYNEINLGKVELKLTNNILEEIIISSKNRTTTSRHGNLKINFTNTTLQNSGSAVDAITQLPGIILNGENMEVLGRGTPLIIIDGQESALIDLNMLRSDQIASVEIIKNPGTEYQASNNVVLKISTVSQKYNGWNMSLRNLVTKGRHLIYYGGTEFGYKNNKSRYYFHFSANPNTIRNEDKYIRGFEKENLTITNKVITDTKENNNYIAKFNTLQDLDEKNSIYFQSIFQSKSSRDITNNENILQGIENPPAIYTQINSPAKNINSVNNFIYSHRLDTLGTKFCVNANYTLYKLQANQTIAQDYNNIHSNFISKSSGISQIYSIKPTMYIPIQKDSSSINLGIHYSYYKSKSDYFFVNRTDNNITEDNLAAYGEYEVSFKKFNYRIGLRYEWVKSSGNQNGDTEIINRNRGDLFPSATLEYKLADDLKTNVGYTRRIARPNLNDLISYHIFLDSLSSFIGNPRLTPSYSNVFNVGLTYKEYASLNASYIKTNKPIFYDINHEGLSTSAGSQNFTSSDVFTVSANIPFEYKFWSIFNSIGVSGQKNIYLDKSLELRNTLFYAGINNNFKVTKDFSINFYYQYTGKNLSGLLKVEPRNTVNLNINKKFWDNRLETFIQWQDIFNQQRYYISTDLDGLNVSNIKFQDTSYFRIGVVFKLNNLDNINNNSNINGDEESRIQKQK